MTHPSKKNTNWPWTSKLLTRETWLESKKARLSLTWGIICKKKSWIWSILLIKWNIIIVTAHSWGQKQQNDATKLSRHAFDHLHVALYLHVARVFLSSDQWWLWPCSGAFTHMPLRVSLGLCVRFLILSIVKHTHRFSRGKWKNKCFW